MKTFYCKFCDKEIQMNFSEWKKENANAYCYCRNATPTMYSPNTRKEFLKEDRKYKNIFKKITFK